MRVTGWLGVGATAWLCACGAPPPSAPSAVITSDPETVCLGDDYRTPILLDGSESAPRLTLAPGAGDPPVVPLRFSWTLRGSAHDIVEGSTASEQLTVRIAADRPLHAELVVRDGEGGEADTLHTVAVTVPDGTSGVCP